MWNTVGCLPDTDDFVRFRGLPDRVAKLPDNLHQFLLGCRPRNRHRRDNGQSMADGRVGVSHSKHENLWLNNSSELTRPIMIALCAPVDVAPSPFHWHIPCTGITVVAYPKGKARRREEVLTPVDEFEQRDRFQCRSHCRNDGTYNRP